MTKQTADQAGKRRKKRRGRQRAQTTEKQDLLVSTIVNPQPYSALSASAGSTAAALRAGIQLASAAIATSVSDAPASVSGSLAATPYRNVRRNRATSANIANPPAT